MMSVLGPSMLTSTVLDVDDQQGPLTISSDQLLGGLF